MPVAEIIFVGLCTFLNVNDQYPKMPPPSVILIRAKHHKPFIAFDSSKTKVEGVVFGNSANGYSYIELEGEELTFNDDRSGKPQPHSSFNSVAQLTKYANLSAMPDWNEDYVPKKMKHPKKDKVAAYAEFGNGELTADCETPIRYAFRDKKGITSITDKFARQVHYKFTPANGILYIEARSLDGIGKRVMKFTPIGTAPLQVWIGNSMDIAEEIACTDTGDSEPATHFAHFYKTMSKKTNKYIPYPVTITAASSGYCGPDSQP